MRTKEEAHYSTLSLVESKYKEYLQFTPESRIVKLKSIVVSYYKSSTCYKDYEKLINALKTELEEVQRQYPAFSLENEVKNVKQI